VVERANKSHSRWIALEQKVHAKGKELHTLLEELVLDVKIYYLLFFI